MKHFFRKLVEQLQIFLIDIVKSPVDRCEIGNFIGGLGETNAFSICNQFFSLIIHADCKIVIQFFNRTHYRTTPKEKPLKA